LKENLSGEDIQHNTARDATGNSHGDLRMHNVCRNDDETLREEEETVFSYEFSVLSTELALYY